MDFHHSKPESRETTAWLQRQLEELDPALKPGPGVRESLERLLEAAIAMERQHLAHTVEDTLVQSLTAVYFTIKVVEANLRRNGLEIPEGLVLMEKLTGRTTAELHAVIKELHSTTGAAIASSEPPVSRTTAFPGTRSVTATSSIASELNG